MKRMNATLYLMIGALLTFIAAIIGLMMGATYGGNNPVPFEYGGLPGYEGAGLFGAILFSSIAAVTWTYFMTPKENRKQATSITTAVCLAELVIQRLVGLQTGVGLFILLFIPILWQIPFATSYKWK